MKRLWNLTCLVIRLFQIATNPNNTKAALAIAENLLNLGLIKDEVDKIKSTGEGAGAMERKKLLSPINLDVLQNCAPGTLGRVYSDRMLAENLLPEFYKPIDIVNDETFVMMSLRQTHDLWHAITGFGTSAPEELGLQAFMMAQCHSPLPPILIGGRLIASAIRSPGECRSIVEQVAKGWLMGKRSKPIFALDWELHWDTPLQQLREAYHISF